MKQRNICIRLAYDGTGYLGWQETQEGPSIESSLRQCLETLLKHPVVLQAASRTDAGVHAQGQVVNFFTETPWQCERLHRALNGMLPRDIAVQDIREAGAAFHPTLDVVEKEYWYCVTQGATSWPHLRHVAWHVHEELNLSAMEKAMGMLTGRHDYRAFCNVRKQMQYRDFVRTVSRFEILKTQVPCWVFVVVGHSFLYKMVRNLVGTVVDVGRGKISLEALPEILCHGDRRLAGVTAPAHGLTLKRIIY